MLSRIAIAIALMALLITAACGNQAPTEPTGNSSANSTPGPIDTPTATTATPTPPPLEPLIVGTNTDEPSNQSGTQVPPTPQPKVKSKPGRPNGPQTPGPALANQSAKQPPPSLFQQPPANNQTTRPWAFACLPDNLQGKLPEPQRTAISYAIWDVAEYSYPDVPPNYDAADEPGCTFSVPKSMATPPNTLYEPLGRPLTESNFRPGNPPGWPPNSPAKAILKRANEIIKDQLGDYFEPGLVEAFLQDNPNQVLTRFKPSDDGSYNNTVEYFDQNPITPGIMGDRDNIPTGTWQAPLVWYTQSLDDSQKVDYQVFFATLLYHKDLELGDWDHIALLALKFTISFDDKGRPVRDQEIDVCVTLFHHPNPKVKPFEECKPTGT